MQYRAASEGAGEYKMMITEESLEKRLVLICKSNLDRECLYNGLLNTGLRLPVVCYETVEHSDIDCAGINAAVLLLHIGAKRVTDPDVCAEIKAIKADWDPVPVILLSECEEWAQVVCAIELGARGYIPTSVGIRVCVEAVHLAMAGGIYIPATSITEKSQAKRTDGHELSGLFTSREIQVIHLLRQGKANKVIAYELNMSEATVKVHMHNIMKKFGATNRTEVAYKLNNLYQNVF
ncbi:MAG TPA: response regulator transcription factor [Pseudochrobactrum sp.]|nr:response regulator transcription factor [Pseudochrobactrum sp.]